LFQWKPQETQCTSPLLVEVCHSVRAVLSEEKAKDDCAFTSHVLHCGLQLPEYYLTAAEADVLAASGHEIVQACLAQQGALLVELGAG
jgi:hypothetical protein